MKYFSCYNMHVLFTTELNVSSSFEMSSRNVLSGGSFDFGESITTRDIQMMNLTTHVCACVCMYVSLNKIISLMPLVSNLEDYRHRHFSPLYSNNIGTSALRRHDNESKCCNIHTYILNHTHTYNVKIDINLQPNMTRVITLLGTMYRKYFFDSRETSVCLETAITMERKKHNYRNERV